MTPEEWLKWLSDQGVPLIAACPVSHGCNQWADPGKPGKVPADLSGRHLAAWQRSDGESPGALLRAYEARHTNIGAVTGRRLRDGRYLVDLDVDGEEGQRQAVALLGGVPGLTLTPAYRTGSGGWHLLFAAKEPMHTVRADGGHQGIALSAIPGFIVLPPSRHIAGGSYVWHTERQPQILALPPLVLRWAKDRSAVRSTAPRSLRPIPAAEMDTAEVLRQLRLYGVPAWTVNRIQRGAGGGDRSGIDMAVVSVLVSRKVPETIIASIYRNPDFAIGEKYRTHATPDRYLALTIDRARTDLEHSSVR